MGRFDRTPPCDRCDGSGRMARRRQCPRCKLMLCRSCLGTQVIGGVRVCNQCVANQQRAQLQGAR